VQVHPTESAIHLAVAGGLGCALGIALSSRAGLAFGGALLVGLAIARAVTQINVARIRAAGFEMLWQTSERVRRVGRSESFELAAELRNRDARAARFARLRAVASPGLSVTVEPESGEVPAGGRLAVQLRITAHGLGRHAVHGLSLELRGGPGLFEVPLTFANPFGIEVLPRVYTRVARSSAGGRSRRVAEQPRSRPLAGDSLELRELRQHQPGDPLRKVAWKASARRGQLLVREHEREERDVVFVLLDAAIELASGTPGSSALERAVDEAASLAVRHLHRGDDVGLGVLGRRVLTWLPPDHGSSHTLQLLEGLAHSISPVHADRSALDEAEVAQRVLDHLRPLAPDVAGSVAAYELDRVARRAEKLLARAPFPSVEVHAGSSRERALRGYLEAFGIGSPQRTGPDRAEVDERLVQALTRLASQRPEPTLVYVLSPAPTPGSRQGVMEALRRRKKRRTQLIWESIAPELSVDAPEGSAFAAARAIVRRAELNRSEGERALRRAGVVVEHIGRGA